MKQSLLKTVYILDSAVQTLLVLSYHWETENNNNIIINNSVFHLRESVTLEIPI